MENREAALQDIATLARQHQLSIKDIAHALEAEGVQEHSRAPRSNSDVAMRLFAYLGGILIFAGIGVYVAMFWEEMNSAARIIITLGTGICAYIAGLVIAEDARYQRLYIPLLVMAALLQPTGLFVTLYELFGHSRDSLAPMLVFGAMTVQQGLTFYKKPHWALLFFTLLFGSATYGNIVNKLEIDADLSTLVWGISILFISKAISASPWRSLSSLGYAFGSLALFWGSFELLEDAGIDILYLGLCAFMVYVSITLQSKILLLSSTLALLSYIGYFTGKHFADTIGWPITLILLGLLFFGVSASAMKLKQRYMT